MFFFHLIAHPKSTVMLPTVVLQTCFLSTFRIPPKTIYPENRGWGPPTVGSTLPRQLSIKKMSHNLVYRPLL